MKRNTNTFYCFSPFVMIATFAIEIGLLLYTIIRYRMNANSRLVAAALLLLAVFQYSEFHVCESIGTTDFYSRLGYAAITMLPPVGIHLVSRIAGKHNPLLLGSAYGSGILFALAFSFSPSAFQGYACGGNYAVFQLADNVGGLFFAYYYFWLFAGISLALKYSMLSSKRQREALIYQVFGYLSFILPTGVVNALNPSTINGIPSIMCGFAVIYALILTFAIAPRMLKEKAAHKKATR